VRALEGQPAAGNCMKWRECDMTHVIRHTSHVTRHASHVTRHTSHVKAHLCQPPVTTYTVQSSATGAQAVDAGGSAADIAARKPSAAT
jgi:hypothetical protein